MKLSGGAVETLPRAEEADYARGTTFHAEPSSVDAGIAHVRDAVMPALEGIEGFIGLSLLADRSTGSGASSPEPGPATGPVPRPRAGTASPC